MRRRLQSFSLAACKDKTTLKTAFLYYDNVGRPTLNIRTKIMKSISTCRLLVVPVKNLKTWLLGWAA